MKAQSTAAVAAPGLNQASLQGKKVLRQGVVVITGASSGLGLATAKVLAESGKWHVVMACRDFLKAEKAAQAAGMAKGSYTIAHLDLASLDSVRQFVDAFRRSCRPLDVLVCNAAIYRPTARKPTYTADGYEMSVGVNHLGHFLLANLLLEDLKKSDYPSRRLIILGSITGTIYLFTPASLSSFLKSHKFTENGALLQGIRTRWPATCRRRRGWGISAGSPAGWTAGTARP